MALELVRSEDSDSLPIEEREQIAKEERRIGSVIDQMEQWYKKNRASEDVRNLSYYRGNFWRGDGFNTVDRETTEYTAQQNEIFPVIDTIVSSLAMDVPQAEFFDQRFASQKLVTREEDLNIAGRRLAAVHNHWAEEDELDITVREWVLHAELFGIGVLKTSWSPILGRPIYRTRLPWEWFCDPSAKRPAEMNWCFEKFVIHIDDFKARVQNGTYNLHTKQIDADTYPRSLVDDQMTDEEEQKAKDDGLKEYVGLIEFWDFRRQNHIHYHPVTKQIVYMGELPYGRPYDVLVFHDAVGRIRGIPDVSLLAPNQKDINIMVSARREMVFRLQQRTLFDAELFDDQEWERFTGSKPWEYQKSVFPPGGIDGHVWSSPPANTNMDFQRHLEGATDSVRWIPGLADYQRGEVANIRTAAEATMVRASVEGRLNIRVKKVVRGITQVFKRSDEVWRWAVDNQDESGIDMEEIAFLTQVDADGTQLTEDLMQGAPRFRLLPFSPLMEDKYARREQLTKLIQMISGSELIMQGFDAFELAREFQELYGLRPSVVREPPPPMPAAPPGMDVNQAPVAGLPLAQGVPANGPEMPALTPGSPQPVAV